MPISDYSHIVTLGHNCTPSFQLARMARRLRWPASRVSGPFAFGNCVGQRVACWKQMLADAQGSLLVLRLSDVVVPDTASDLERLAAALTRRCAGSVRVAAVSFSNSLAVSHPIIQTFAIRPVWPAHLDVSEVDWNADYGEGVTWKGHDASWGELWNVV